MVRRAGTPGLIGRVFGLGEWQGELYGAGEFHDQLRYRDPASCCTPDRFNISSGLGVVGP